MRVAFVDFHAGFNPSNNIFLNSLREVFGIPIEVTSLYTRADIIFCSVFGTAHPKVLGSYRSKTILWLGENLRPRSFNCAYSISTDIYRDNHNFRLPLWYLEIDWHNTGLGVVSLADAITLLYRAPTNELTNQHLKKPCIAIFNNPEGSRILLLESLQKYFSVECYGKPFGNWFPTEASYKDKLNNMQGYAFNLCPENSYYPGYYTEKCFHAKLAGAVPIYMADSHLRLDFRPDCMLNLYDYTSAADLARDAYHLYNSPEALNNMANEPLLSSVPSLAEFYGWLRYIVSKIITGG